MTDVPRDPADEVAEKPCLSGYARARLAGENPPRFNRDPARREDVRERPVKCRWCNHLTWANDGLCDVCADRPSARPWTTEDS